MMNIRISQATWEADKEPLMAIRHQVFIVEQQVPPEIEIDEADPEAIHFLALEHSGKAIGTCRLLLTGKIGRVAVLKPWRGKGIGRNLMQAAMQHAAERGLQMVSLDAQCSSREFYEKLGFEGVGEIFEEVGMPHIKMVAEVE
ncbi:MAG: GNAT family N-acetyltransferase [Verrucomicrobiota bacterium]